MVLDDTPQKISDLLRRLNGEYGKVLESASAFAEAIDGLNAPAAARLAESLPALRGMLRRLDICRAAIGRAESVIASAAAAAEQGGGMIR